MALRNFRLNQLELSMTALRDLPKASMKKFFPNFTNSEAAILF